MRGSGRTMRRMGMGVVATALLGVSGEAEEDAKPTPDEAPATIPDWTQRPDFAALRSQWATREDFFQRCESSRPLGEAFERIETKKWEELLELATPWVERCPVDMDAHALRAVALDQLGRAEEGEHHRAWMRGSFEAVMATGDGKTPETAYQVIAVYEEYSMLRFFGYQPKGQALVAGRVDAISVLAEGEERAVYFDPAASFQRMEKMLTREPETQQ